MVFTSANLGGAHSLYQRRRPWRALPQCFRSLLQVAVVSEATFCLPWHRARGSKPSAGATSDDLGLQKLKESERRRTRA